MLQVVVRRLLQLVPVLLGLSLLVFVWVRSLPGDPAAALLAEAQPSGTAVTKEAVTEVRRLYGLDRPVQEQYVSWLGNVVTLDLGQSVTTRQDVADELRRRFPATVELALAALIVAVGVGIPLGFAAGWRAGTWLDHLSLGTALVGVSVPVFFLAFVLKYVFSVKLGWLPSVGRLDVTRDLAHPTGFYVLDAVLAGDGAALADALRHLVLPAVALGSGPAAFIARITRAAVLDVASEGYVDTATAKGLGSWTVGRRHALRSALVPITAVVGLTAGVLLEGAALVEVVFAWGGMGSLLFQAIVSRDYPVLQAGILYVAVVFVVVNLAVDVLSALLDPRARTA